MKLINGTNYNSIFSRYHKSSKKYVLVFNRWVDNKIKAKSITEYDTLKEAQEEIELINEIYKDTPKPSEGNNKIDDSSYWGYLLIDFENEKVIVGNDGIYHPYRFDKESFKKKYKLHIMDYFFRKDEEIPKDYKWNGIEEYCGWLQFRWGDGKNAIEYVDNLKNKKKSTKSEDKDTQDFEDTRDEIDEIVDKFDNELTRQMIERKDYKW